MKKLENIDEDSLKTDTSYMSSSISVESSELQPEKAASIEVINLDDRNYKQNEHSGWIKSGRISGA